MFSLRHRKHGRCVYCGTPTSLRAYGVLVCRGHSDLPVRDPAYTEARW